MIASSAPPRAPPRRTTASTTPPARAGSPRGPWPPPAARSASGTEASASRAADQHQQDGDHSRGRDEPGPQRPVPELGQRLIVRRAADRLGVEREGVRRVSAATGMPTTGPIASSVALRTSSASTPSVGRSAPYSISLKSIRAVCRFCDGRDPPRRRGRRGVQHRRGEARAVDRGHHRPHVVGRRASAASAFAPRINRSTSAGSAARGGAPRSRGRVGELGVAGAADRRPGSRPLRAPPARPRAPRRRLSVRPERAQIRNTRCARVVGQDPRRHRAWQRRRRRDERSTAPWRGAARAGGSARRAPTIGQPVDGRIVVEANDDERLAVIGGQLERDRRDRCAPGPGSGAAPRGPPGRRSPPAPRTSRPRRDRPPTRRWPRPAARAGSSARRRSSCRTTGSSRSARTSTKTIGAALHWCVPTCSRGDMAATSQRQRRRAARAPPSGGAELVPAVGGVARPRAAERDGAGRPSAARRAGQPHAGHRHERERRGRGRRGRQRAREPPASERTSCARRAATITKKAQTAANAERQDRRARGAADRARAGAPRDRPATAPGPGPRPRAPAAAPARAIQSATSTKKRTSRPFSERNHPSASARRTMRCRASSPSLSLCPRASTGRALGLPHGSTVTLEQRRTGRTRARTPGTAASRCSASPSASPVGRARRRRPPPRPQLEADQAEARAGLPAAHHGRGVRGGPGEGVLGRARRQRGQRHDRAQHENDEDDADGQGPESHAGPKLHKAGGYRTNVAARATTTLRSASASERMLLSINIWYSSRRCVLSRYGPSVLMV